jgi:hypothetical protein
VDNEIDTASEKERQLMKQRERKVLGGRRFRSFYDTYPYLLSIGFRSKTRRLGAPTDAAGPSQTANKVLSVPPLWGPTGEGRNSVALVRVARRGRASRVRPAATALPAVI